MISRLDITAKALSVVNELEEKYGPLMFYRQEDVVKELSLSVLKKEVFFRG